MPSNIVAVAENPGGLGLSPRGKRLVERFAQGGISQADAAAEVGYSKGSAGSSAYRVMASDAGRGLLLSLLSSARLMGAMSGLARINKLIDSAESEHVQLAASKLQLEALFPVVRHTSSRVSGSISVEFDLSGKAG